uniref:Uncharacterized protein n=2 Tax=Lepeophtheirus salmonis TaxID=72036 RepID=A0A0K2UEK5_LEPSM
MTEQSWILVVLLLFQETYGLTDPRKELLQRERKYRETPSNFYRERSKISLHPVEERNDTFSNLFKHRQPTFEELYYSLPLVEQNHFNIYKQLMEHPQYPQKYKVPRRSRPISRPISLQKILKRNGLSISKFSTGPILQNLAYEQPSSSKTFKQSNHPYILKYDDYDFNEMNENYGKGEESETGSPSSFFPSVFQNWFEPTPSSKSKTYSKTLLRPQIDNGLYEKISTRDSGYTFAETALLALKLVAKAIDFYRTVKPYLE